MSFIRLFFDKLWSDEFKNRIQVYAGDVSKKFMGLDKNMYHFHRKRDDSVSFTEGEGTRTSIEYFRDLILNYTIKVQAV